MASALRPDLEVRTPLLGHRRNLCGTLRLIVGISSVPSVTFCETFFLPAFFTGANRGDRARSCVSHQRQNHPFPIPGVRGQVRALDRGDMSPRNKAASCRRTPDCSPRYLLLNFLSPRFFYRSKQRKRSSGSGFLYSQFNIRNSTFAISSSFFRFHRISGSVQFCGPPPGTAACAPRPDLEIRAPLLGHSGGPPVTSASRKMRGSC